ncbi:MAG: glycosyltransferase [Flavobacteriaceae bacterium]
MQKIIISVTNDLTTDQRVHKVSTSIQKMGYEILLVGRKLENSQKLERNYKTHRIDLLFNKGFLFYAEYNVRLFLYLLFKKKAILLANDLDTLLPNYLVSKIQNKKLIYDSHELFTEVPELVNRPKTQRIWLKLEQRIVPKLKNSYTVCNSIANYYNTKYKTDFKVVRNIPVFVKQEVRSRELEVRSKKQEAIPKTIIYQGATNIGRGLELMIETMAFLNNHQLIIIGGGEILSDLKEKVLKENLEHKITFLGKKTPTELKKITPTADLGISIEEDLGLNYRYALPNKLFDYIHANVPVLVSNLPEMKAVVNQYNIGEIVIERTPKVLANQIENLLNSDLSSIKENLKIAAQKLTWKNEEKVLRDLFHNIK